MPSNNGRSSTTYRISRRRMGVARRSGRYTVTDGRANNNANFARTDMRQQQRNAARGTGNPRLGRNDSGRFTNTGVRTYGSTVNGRLAVIDERGRANAANARTWTMTDRDYNGNLVRQSGRSQIANRSQRAYDVRAGFNDISPRAARAMLDAGQISQAEYDRMFGGATGVGGGAVGGAGGGGRGGSLGLSNG